MRSDKPPGATGKSGMSDVVGCRKCGAPTRLVVVANSGKGLLVDAQPRRDYVIVGVTDSGVALVELRDTWVAHTHETPRRHP